MVYMETKRCSSKSIWSITSNSAFTSTDNNEFYGYTEVVSGSTATDNRKHTFISNCIVTAHGWNISSSSTDADFVITPRKNGSDLTDGIITIGAGLTGLFKGTINQSFESGDNFNVRLNYTGTASLVAQGRTCEVIVN